MKIAAISMVKNESDIIELFIKINSRFFDAIYILDHGSTDSTAQIVRLMKKSGYNVYYTLLNDKIYNQSKITTSAIRQIAQLDLYDYLMPLDADEFIPDEKIGLIRDFLSERHGDLDVGYFPWKTYCPINRKYFEAEAPLYDNFKARRIELSQFYKVIVTNRLGKFCTIAMGNHDITTQEETGALKRHIIPSFLIHAPIRSQEQIISKAVLGSHSFKLKKDRVPGEGFHWDELTQQIREKNYSISDEMLFQVAANYAVPKEKWVKDQPINDAIEVACSSIGRAEDSIEFIELAKINLLRNFDMHINELIGGLVKN